MSRVGYEVGHLLEHREHGVAAVLTGNAVYKYSGGLRFP